MYYFRALFPAPGGITLHEFGPKSARGSVRGRTLAFDREQHYSTFVNIIVGFFRPKLDFRSLACCPGLMRKRSSKRKQRPEDANEAAFRVRQEATGEAPPKATRKKNPAAVALGKVGGAKGGKARAARLTPEQRREIAKRAARARWHTS